MIRIGSKMSLSGRNVTVCGRDSDHPDLYLVGSSHGFEMTDLILDQLRGSFMIDADMKYSWVNAKDLRPAQSVYYPVTLAFLKQQIANEIN